MKYGTKPHNIGHFEVAGPEQFSYQYLPIKLSSTHSITVEKRLEIPFTHILGATCCDFIGRFGINRFVDSYVYLTAKRKLQTPIRTITRPGWHTDGFMTDDTNYIWSDVQPTIFNFSNFNLSDDDFVSIQEMGDQADPKNNYTYENGTLLRLDPFVVHRANDSPYFGIRTFIKISFSKDQYDLEGNSHNYLLNYNWEMRPRGDFRNIPQLIS